jgi:hypothetical protein
MILLGSLLDREAFPWQCDWYRARVKEHLGDRADDNFRLWYTEHALHGDQAGQLEDPTRVVSYLGVLHQALRDLSAWVEKGIEPPASTAYQIIDGQVVIPPSAAERKGIQPVVKLAANAGEIAVMAVGEPVEFEGTIQLPPQTGKVAYAEFDLDGSGSFTKNVELEPGADADPAVRVKLAHRFERPGTYFVVLRASANRRGDPKDAFVLIKNLARVRVIVK